MKGLRILYLGVETGTCLDRANAYRRLGHDVIHINPRRLLPPSAWIDRLGWHVGPGWFAPLVHGRLQKQLTGLRFDVCHVDDGQWLSPEAVRLLRAHCSRIINYNIDDPTGPRDGRRFHLYREAIREYDLAVVMREANVKDLASLGMTRVLRVHMTADEVTHRPRQLESHHREKWASQVLFLGTWMPERGPFLTALAAAGIPLSIRGAHWQKAPEWNKLAPHWKGPSISGDDYAYAIQCAQINLGLLSKGNRDQHTTRSMEIPALGGLLCAERTPEHLDLYREGEEAFFWDSIDECIAVCTRLLNAPSLCRSVAERGHTAHLMSPHRNERMLVRVLETLST